MEAAAKAAPDVHLQAQGNKRNRMGMQPVLIKGGAAALSPLERRFGGQDRLPGARMGLNVELYGWGDSPACGPRRENILRATGEERARAEAAAAKAADAKKLEEARKAGEYMESQRLLRLGADTSGKPEGHVNSCWSPM